MAVMLELEMASVEAQHASIRRLQHVTSVQAPGEHIADGSAEYLLRRFRHLGICMPKVKTMSQLARERQDKPPASEPVVHVQMRGGT